MYISRKHLPRRTVLRGLGTALALPFLDSMVPALTALSRTAAAPVKRFGVFYVPNGMSMPFWSPEREGPLDTLPPTLRSLSALKEHILMCGGLDDEAANMVKGGGDHSRSAGTFLTCVPYKLTAGADVYAAVSMDQIAARELGQQTQLTSLELGIESNAMLGSCDGGASCAYTNTVAWRTPTTPLPIENNPRALFERLFGSSGTTDPEARQVRMRRDRSLLDAVNGELQFLGQSLGPGDQVKLDEYLEAVRDAERRIQLAERQNATELPVVDRPIGTPGDYAEHARLLMDLLALAYPTDMTRISTFMLAREVSSRAYPEIGVSDSHHPLSHHQDRPINLQRLHLVNEYHFQQFAYLVKRLAETPEGDGTMLDSTLFLYGTGISDSNTHFHEDLPIALIGGKSAGITGGRYVRYPQGTPLANLHTTILEKLGTPVESFGDSTGTLRRLAV
ncbi:MAG: DUF1552 domain-containing protein [Acidobacteria bacterium]|nr:DUF1552 domain-containing protein [Acidobacteriota bacterium]